LRNLFLFFEAEMKTLVRPSQIKLRQPSPTPAFWLGLNVHALRLKAGITQAQLAKAAHISVRSLWGIESAAPESNPELRTIAALAAALGTEVSVLFKARPETELVQV
jgi:DNA-binding XRE family transcriptional regulator